MQRQLLSLSLFLVLKIVPFDSHACAFSRMRAWGEALSVKRVGCKRLMLGNFKRGKLCCIAAAEVVWW